MVGWTHAAEQLVGYSAAEVVGRSAAHVLPPAEDAPSASAFAEQCRAQDGWSGTVMVRHRDGHAIKMTLRISLLWGQDAGTRWLVSVTDIGTLSSGCPTELCGSRSWPAHRSASPSMIRSCAVPG